MKKNNIFTFVLGCVFLCALAQAEVVEIEGRQLTCAKSSMFILKCKDGNENVLVTFSERGYVAVVKKGDVVLLKDVSKVSDESKVLYESTKVEPIQDTKLNRISSANSVINFFKYSQDPDAKVLLATAEEFIKKEGTLNSNLKVTISGSKESYQCKKGGTKNPDANMECSFFSCSGKDKSEKVIMYLPKPGSSFNSANLLSMKNGQASLITGDFQVTDGSATPVGKFPKLQSLQDESGIDPDLLVPSEFDSSKSSFSYLNSYAANDFSDADGQMNVCGGEPISSLFAEQKRIAEKMQKALVEADLVEYLKLIDGNINSFYVDRKKGMDLGCMYQGKIVDRSVLGKLDYLKDISVTKPVSKYLSIEEVQNLFNEAKSMKDIPFGYKYDGCYARAHIMARRFEEKGIVAQKVWIKGDLSVPDTDIRWGYHVAPVVEVMTKEGKIEKYVIDPSLTEKAVTVDEWVGSIGKGSKGPVMKTTYPFPNNGLDFQRTVVAISPTDVYAPTDMSNLQEADKMAMSTQVLQEFSQVLEGKRDSSQRWNY